MRRGLLLIALLAALVRVGYEAALAADDGPVGALAGHLLGDERAYDALGRDVAAGTVERTRAFYQEPFYAWLLGQLYRLLPPAPLEGGEATVPHDAVHRVVIWLQHGLGVLVALLTAALGARALSRRAGLLAGVLAALSGPLVFHEAQLLKATLSLVVLLAASHLWLDLLQRQGALRRALLLGLVLGLGILLRGNLYLLLGAVLLSLLLPLGVARRQPLAALLVAAGALAALSPLTLYNLRRGDLVLTTYQAGSNIAIGQPPTDDPQDGVVYEPLRAGRGDARYEEQDAVDLAEAALGRTASGREISAWWWEQARRTVQARPRVALQRAGLKLAHLFAGGEVPDVKAWGFFSAAVPWLATPLSDMRLVGPWALAGLLLLPWRRRPGLLVVRSGVLVVGATLVLFYVMGRYRLGAAPGLWILAAGALETGLGVLRHGRRWRRVAVVVLGLGLPALAWWSPPPPRVEAGPVSWANASTVAKDSALRAPSPGEARAWRERALAWAEAAIAGAPLFESAQAARLRALTLRHPDLPLDEAAIREQAWRLLLLMEGLRTGADIAPRLPQPEGVLRPAALSLAQVPSLPGGDALAGPLLAEACLALTPWLREEGELPLALRLAERGLLFDPANPGLGQQRALVLKRLGRLQEAEAAWRALLADGVRSVELHNNYGNLLLQLGRPAEAVEQLQQAAALAPGNALVLRNLERARQAEAAAGDG